MAISIDIILDWIKSNWVSLIIVVSLLIVMIIIMMKTKHRKKQVEEEQEHKHEWTGRGVVVLHKDGKEYPRVVWTCDCGEAIHTPVKSLKQVS